MRAGSAAVVIIMLAATCAASDAAPDWHVSYQARGHALFCKSAFVHGYMHGYEQGFHAADLDLNFGRSARDPEKIDQYRDPAGYQHVFGDRHLFENGYHEGFRVGYSDGINERAFRAVSQARAAAEGLADDDQTNGKPTPNKSFDEGFSAGYNAGSDEGLRDGRGGAPFRNTAATCVPTPTGSDRSVEYCAGYARGYRFGYSDGYVTQIVQPEQHRGNLQQLPASVLLETGTVPRRK